MRRRRGRPGIAGTMARTAVVAGTASAVAGPVSRHQAGKAQDQQAEGQTQAEMAEMQAQLDALQAQQAQQAAPPPPPAAAPANDLMGKLQQLGDMKAAGLLTDEEFAAAKAQLLAG